MSTEEEFDTVFGDIANRSGGLTPLFERFFGFLHRKTDFYVEFAQSKDKNESYRMGFPKGKAEKLLLDAYRRYPTIPYHMAIKSTTSATNIDSVVTTSRDNHSVSPTILPNGKQLPIGNGGVADTYYWTQTLKDLTIFVDVPKDLKGKDVNCVVKSSSILLVAKGVTYLNGALEESVKLSESMWTINRGDANDSTQIIITLDKSRQNWWKQVIIGHPEIDTTKVDSTQSITEYDPATQATIRKLMFDQQQKVTLSMRYHNVIINIVTLILEIRSTFIRGTPNARSSFESGRSAALILRYLTHY